MKEASTMAWIRTPENKLYKNEHGDKVLTTDWQNAPIELWNSTTVLEYVNARNLQLYGVTPLRVNVKLSQITCARDIKEYSAEAVKKWIDVAMRKHKPTREFPTITYITLRNFYMAELMPAVLKQLEEEKAAHKDFDIEEVVDLF